MQTFQKFRNTSQTPFREPLIRIVVSDEIILGNLDSGAKPISPPCKGGRGDFGTVSYGTTNRITRHSSIITLTTSPESVQIPQTLSPTHVSTDLWYLRPKKSGYLHYLHHSNSLLYILLIKEIEKAENRQLTTKN